MKSPWTFLFLFLVVLAVRGAKEEPKSEEEAACLFDQPLGMISGGIKSWQISSSSTYPSKWAANCEEHNARLYQRNGVSWCAKYASPSEWLQVDLGVASTITGVLTQGRGDGKEWVKEFLISYSLDANHWRYVLDNYRNQKIFEGNSDAYTVKHNYLDNPITARFIKFHTRRWENHPSMRVEIHGCQPCKHLLGAPPYVKMAASSSRGMRSKKSCAPEYGHILSNKAWCAKRQDPRQWLQLDLGPPTKITGLVVKGRGDRKRHWVTSFKVSYSNDSRVWFFYKDQAFLNPKKMLIWRDVETNNLAANSEGMVFAGNTNRDEEKVHYLNSPFVARYVRFHPLRWRGRIAMRAGLFGCPHVGACAPGFFRINKHSKCITNLAYKKEAFINLDGGRSANLLKRHLKEDKNSWIRLEAKKAVDGDLDGQLRSCSILTNQNVDIPMWFVDLKERATVSGVRIHTWQGRGQGARLSFSDYFANLDRLTIFVTSEPHRTMPSDRMTPCGIVTRLNEALFNRVIHIQCNQPVTGQYVYIEAFGVSTRWQKRFSAVLCEVEVY